MLVIASVSAPSTRYNTRADREAIHTRERQEGC